MQMLLVSHVQQDGGVKVVLAHRTQVATHAAQVVGVGPGHAQVAARERVHLDDGDIMVMAAMLQAHQHIAQVNAKAGCASCLARRPHDVVVPATRALKAGRRQTLGQLAVSAMPVGLSAEHQLRLVRTVRRANIPQNKALIRVQCVRAASLLPQLAQMHAANVPWVSSAAVC